MWFRGRTWRLGTLAALTLLAPAVAVSFPGDDINDSPIRYASTTPDDPITRLAKKLESGETRLSWKPERGYLDSLLQYLGISPTSQLLVFSKTSFQRDLISPHTPRALYFNDDVYVGYVQGGPVLELSTADPRLGGVFYVLEQRLNTPKVVRQQHECLSCHQSGLTMNVPGHTVRSVLPLRDGLPVLSAGTSITTPESPYDRRYGGWFVSGNHGELRMLGNLQFGNAEEAEHPDRDRGANVKNLGNLVDLAPYPARHSDLVAHLVLTHQVHVHNLLTRASYDTRKALEFETLLNKELGRPGYRSDSTTSRIKAACEPLVRGLVSAGEAPLTSPVRGSSGFAEQFARLGPRDEGGISLRDLDLKTRVFRYPCSYLVHSRSFEALPLEAREYVIKRLKAILTSDQAPELPEIDLATRRATWKHLTTTLPRLFRD